MKQINQLIQANSTELAKQRQVPDVARKFSLPVLKPQYMEELMPTEAKVYKYITPTDTNRLISEMSIDEKMALSESIIRHGKSMLGLKKLDLDGFDEGAVDLVKTIFAVLEDFPMLTRNEIVYVIKKGFNGDYLDEGKELNHIKPIDISRWINKYKNTEKTALFRKLGQLMDKQNREDENIISEEEQFKGLIHVVNLHIKNYTEDETFNAYGASPLYDQLIRFKIMPEPSVSAKNEAIDRAKDRHAREKIENPKIPAPTKERLIVDAKTILYNDFIKELGDFQKVLDERGKIVDSLTD